MIFITVGTDMPFDRLIKAVDGWAKERNRTDVFAQIGEGAWTPEFIDSVPFLSPSEFATRCRESSVIVAHAGMGTILSSLHAGKPLLVMPRRASLGEQRNEHQLATARHMEGEGKVTVAFDEEDLVKRLDSLEDLSSKPAIGPYASDELVQGLRNFIFSKS